MKTNTWARFILTGILFLLLGAAQAPAQIQVGGDVMMRYYWENAWNTRDDRESLNSSRILSRLYVDTSVGEHAAFHADLVTISENPVYPARTISGAGNIIYGISQVYGEMMTPNLPLFDLARLRFGRQHYKLGQGLTLGDSYYQLDMYDSVRADLMVGNFTFGLMGAVTSTEVSSGGYYPKPGSDRIYVGKVEYELYDHTLLGYTVYEAPQGDFNDNVITGLGAKGRIVLRDLQYFGELATQNFNTLSGLPDKGGMAYMGGISYRWSMKGFRTIKVEVRGAGYEGDDAGTEKVEIFEPYYPSWYWGDRTAYVNGSIGGDYSHRGIRPEGSRVWYGRVYFSPTSLPKWRFQLQYATVSDWIDNDGFDAGNDEWGLKLFYEINSNVRLQGRYFRRMASGADEDLNASGIISRSEDEYEAQRIMVEMRVQF
ncbi:MAG: hypothetical protein GY838_16690 [bacterium]|nr:hypothetical protein [bacterium]